LCVRWERDKTVAGRASGELPTQPVQPAVQVAKKSDQGQKLLEAARRELRAGETRMARRMAEDAFKGDFGVRAEAETLLRSIDAEEFEQRRIVADKTFDAGLSAFRRKDFSQAETIFTTLDCTLLSAEKKSKLKNVLMSTELQPHEVAKVDSGVMQAGTQNGPGRANATDKPGKTPTSPEETLAQQVKGLMDVQFQKLRKEGLDAQ